MAIAYDTSTNLASGTDTRSWSHTGSASARGAIVVVLGGAVDSTSGVTYGGVAMTRAQTGVNAGGESGTVSVWFLGQDLPTGTQTVQVTRNTAVDAYIATCYTVTSATGVVEYITGDNGNSTNISTIATSLTIPSGKQVFMAGGLYSGENALGSITDNADLTRSHSQDFGNFVGVVNRKTTLYTGTGAAYTNFAWTQSSDDGAWAAIAVAEGVVATAKSDSETLTPSVTEGESIAVVFDSKSDSETLTPSITEFEAITALVTDSDTATVSFTDDETVTPDGGAPVEKSDSDTATVSVTESSEHTITEGTGGSPATYVAHTTTNLAASPQIDFTKPGGVVNGDVALFHISFWSSGQNITGVPSGAVLVGSHEEVADNFGGVIKSFIYAKRVGAESTYTFSWADSLWRSGHAVYFTNVDSGDDLSALAAAFTSNNTQSTTAPAVGPITVTDGSAVAYFINGEDDDTPWTATPPTGFTERNEEGFAYLATADDWSGTSATADAVTTSRTNNYITIIVAVPGSGSPSTETRVFGDTDAASVLMTDGGEDIVIGGAPIEKTDSETLTVSVTESESIVTFSDVPGTDTLAISVTESESIVIQTEKYISGLSANGRYFVDQNGDPILVRGDSPWGILFNNTPAEAESYWTSRASQGFNAVLCSLIPDTTNGADSSSGQTFDGIAPFTGGNIDNPNEAYWTRIDQHISNAADAGITILLYPLDSWTMGGGSQNIMSGFSNTQYANFGTWLAQRYSAMPNIIWMVGGDYFEPFLDTEFTACLDAIIAELGASNILTGAQLFEPEYTMRQTSGAWSRSNGRADFNFVYVYDVAYDLVQQAYNQITDRPALMSENKYLDESGVTGTMFRKNTLWSYTSGSPGDIVGSADWPMSNGTWQAAINDPDFIQHSTYADWFAALPGWWELVPDTGDTFILTGQGTKTVRTNFTEGNEDIANINTNTFATASLNPDGSMAVCYVPTQRAITIDLTQLNSNPVAKWVHPTTLAETAIADPSTSITPPAAGDWLLYITADSAAVPISDSDTLNISVTDTEQVDAILQVVTDSDTVTVSVTDTESSDGAVAEADTATISVTDAEAVTQIITYLAESDSATVSITESAEIFVTLSDDDSATVSASDTSGSDGSVSDSDTATISVTDSGVAEVAGNNPVDPDTAYITIAETEVIDVGTPGTDTLSIAVAEVESIFGVVTDSDTATISVVEDGSFGQVNQSDSDTATVSITESEAVNVVLDSKSDSEILTVSATESEGILVTVSDTDTLQPSIVESVTVGLTLVDSDSLTISITESENAVSGAPWTVQFWNGTALLESGQFQYWDGTQLIGVTADEPLVWDGTQFVPLSSL